MEAGPTVVITDSNLGSDADEQLLLAAGCTVVRLQASSESELVAGLTAAGLVTVGAVVAPGVPVGATVVAGVVVAGVVVVEVVVLGVLAACCWRYWACRRAMYWRAALTLVSC